MNRLFERLHLNSIGFFEILVALYPIISQYSFGVLHMNFVMLLFLDIMAVIRNPKTKWFGPLTALIVFYSVHELIVYLFFTDMPRYMVGDVLTSLIIAVSIPIVATAVHYEKLVGSFQWVALLCLGGLIYHYLLIMSGNLSSVHPLTLPFFPDLDLSSRAFEDIYRPTSFFWEPSSYATFMMIPLFFCLSERIFLLGTFYALSIFLSSSTNGIILSSFLFAGFFFIGNFKAYQKVIVAFLVIILSFSLFNSSLFTQGVDKIENTSLSSNQRIMNGPNLVSETPGQYLFFGADAPNIIDFLSKHPDINTSKLTFLGSGGLFVSDFWRVLVKYGFFGLIPVLLMYFKAYKLCKEIRPYILVLLVALFSQSVVLGSSWGYEWIFIIAFIFAHERQN